ncbi:hypothetical protein [Paraburkholderia sp. GAS334]|uniref:hypothetical protein n=1 Tax=Paraburkholderia sp. GAS334 TaxID=3035131 RepID=UPI003D237666
MKRQVLKTILFVLQTVLDLTARRFPVYRDRLKERDLVDWKRSEAVSHTYAAPQMAI